MSNLNSSITDLDDREISSISGGVPLIVALPLAVAAMEIGARLHDAICQDHK